MSWVVAPLVMAVLILSLGRLFVLQGKQRRWGLVYGLVALALVLGCAGCGSGGVGGSGGGGGNTNPGTPVGTYTITVSFTINGVTETVPNLTVNVQ